MASQPGYDFSSIFQASAKFLVPLSLEPGVFEFRISGPLVDLVMWHEYTKLIPRDTGA
jgi:hypothetical protein